MAGNAGHLRIPPAPGDKRFMLARYIEQSTFDGPDYVVSRLADLSLDDLSSPQASPRLERMISWINTGDQRLEKCPRGVQEEEEVSFLCIFAFAGCKSSFPNKHDWKNHICSEHIGLYYWVCTQGGCGCILQDDRSQLPSSRSDRELSQESPSPNPPRGAVFRSELEYTGHLYLHHPACSLVNLAPDSEAELQRAFSHFSVSQRVDKGFQLPTDLQCPAPGCSAGFHGAEALSLWLDHIGNHIEQISTGTSASMVIDDLQHDDIFTQWASSPEVAIVCKLEIKEKKVWLLRRCLQYKSAPSFKDSGYGCSEPTSSPTDHGHPDLFHDHTSGNSDSEEYQDQALHEDSAGIDEEATTVPDSHEVEMTTSDTSSVADTISGKGVWSSSNRGPDRNPHVTSDPDLPCLLHSSFTDEVVQFTTSWLRNLLEGKFATADNHAPEDKESGDPSSVSKGSSGAGGRSLKRGVGDDGSDGPRKSSKRDGADKRRKGGGSDGGGGGGDGNGRSDGINNDTQVSGLRFACPFFKHDRAKYGQPRWRACVHPGWGSIPRLKEHLLRNHKLPDYYCDRCQETTENAHQLWLHRRKEPPCSLQAALEGITPAQATELKSRKLIAKPCSEEWRRVYKILFDKTENIPEPYQDRLPDSSVILNQYVNAVSGNFPSFAQRFLSSIPHTYAPEAEEARLVGALQDLLQSAFAQILSGQRIPDTGGGILLPDALGNTAEPPPSLSQVDDTTGGCDSAQTDQDSFSLDIWSENLQDTYTTDSISTPDPIDVDKEWDAMEQSSSSNP